MAPSKGTFLLEPSTISETFLGDLCDFLVSGNEAIVFALYYTSRKRRLKLAVKPSSPSAGEISMPESDLWPCTDTGSSGERKVWRWEDIVRVIAVQAGYQRLDNPMDSWNTQWILRHGSRRWTIQPLEDGNHPRIRVGDTALRRPLGSSQPLIYPIEHIIEALKSLRDTRSIIYRGIGINSEETIISRKVRCVHRTNLEFTMSYCEDQGVGVVKTATPEFMAFEVSLGIFCFITVKRDGPRIVGPTPGRRSPKPTFRRNSLHDVESVCRILMWTVLRYQPAAPLASYEKQMLWQRVSTYQRLFRPPYMDRHASLQPDYLHPLSFFGELLLEGWCDIISDYVRSEYWNVESAIPITGEIMNLDDPFDFPQRCLAEMHHRVQRSEINTIIKVEDVHT